MSSTLVMAEVTRTLKSFAGTRGWSRWGFLKVSNIISGIISRCNRHFYSISWFLIERTVSSAQMWVQDYSCHYVTTAVFVMDVFSLFGWFYVIRTIFTLHSQFLCFIEKKKTSWVETEVQKLFLDRLSLVDASVKLSNKVLYDPEWAIILQPFSAVFTCASNLIIGNDNQSKSLMKSKVWTFFA